MSRWHSIIIITVELNKKWLAGAPHAKTMKQKGKFASQYLLHALQNIAVTNSIIGDITDRAGRILRVDSILPGQHR